MNIRFLLAAMISFAIVAHPAMALVSFNDGKDKVYVNAGVTMGYDSNIYAAQNGGGDMTYSASYGLEYTRRAGMIGVNANLSATSTKFGTHSSQDFDNPTVSVELTKQSGRTTGSLLTRISRQSEANIYTNERDTSWNYEAGLNTRYPVSDRYTLSGSIGYFSKQYTSDPTLTDLNSYTASLDTVYVYNSERDLIAGYRYRYSDTTDDSTYTDHAFTVGVSGKLLAKLNGDFRIGYQVRVPTKAGDETTDGITASSSATWTISKRMNLTLRLTKDFTTTSRDLTVDATSGSSDLQYTLNAKTSLSATVGGGVNRFLGIDSEGREDEFFTWSIGGSYSLNSFLKGSLNYTYYKNWSNQALSSFDRNSINVSLSTRF